MTDTVVYEMRITVDGVTVSETDHYETEAYEKIEVVIPKNSVPTNVNLALMGITGLLITADVYTDLAYSVNELAAPILLDKPQMFLGEGALALLAIGVMDLLFVNSNVTVDRNVTIMVIRDAVI